MSPPGIEETTAGELCALGCTNVVKQEGGVLFDGDLRAANLWLRTASRVLAIVGRGRAASFPELCRAVARVPWERYLAPGRPVELRVSCKRSRLYHDVAVAERVRHVLGSPPPEGEDPLGVHVRLHNDRLTLSVDSSGPLLHRRGYRLEPSEAPLRENLAAAVLLASRWDRRSPVLDPMCGSGTFLCEAAWIAQGRPPGALRSFCWETWPCMAGTERPAFPIDPKTAPPKVLGFDRNARAVAAARANLSRAGVAATVEQADIRDLQPAGCEPGLLVTNPPYGRRIGGASASFALVREVAGRLSGWETAVLWARPGPLPRGWEPFLRFRSGGIAVRAIRLRRG